MATNKIKILLFLSLIFLTISCQVYRTNDEELICPKPEIKCEPVKYKGIARDTSLDVAKMQGWHYKIEKVKQVNSNDNEWAITFRGKEPLITLSDKNLNRLMQAQFVDVNNIIPITLVSLYLVKKIHSFQSLRIINQIQITNFWILKTEF